MPFSMIFHAERHTRLFYGRVADPLNSRHDNLSAAKRFPPIQKRRKISRADFFRRVDFYYTYNKANGVNN